jgi:hypothetical protein
MIVFAQINQGLLSLTGVIATILSVIFGVAAFYNSRTRKKHLKELERAQKQEHAIHFRPAKSSHPGSRSTSPSRSSRPHQSSGLHQTDRTASAAPRAAPVAKVYADPEKPAASFEPIAPAKDVRPLFRKVNPSGSANNGVDSETDEKDHYVWE